jgi:hypothetical protein
MNTVKNYFFLFFILFFSNSSFATTLNEAVKTRFYEGSSQNSHSFKLSLSQPLAVDASVFYETEDGTALAGQDYIAISGTAVILAGKTSILIPVEILGDLTLEKDETFSLIISKPTGGIFSEDLTEMKVTYTILNDDIEIRVHETANNHIHYFLLQIATPLAMDASVNYQTRNGTATAGEDYESTSGVAIIKAGETKTLIAVKIWGDTKIEKDETFSLVISNPIGATFGPETTEIVSTHTIVNDDFAAPVDPTQSIAKNLSRTMLSGVTPILTTQTILEQPADFANPLAMNISNRESACPSSGTFEFTFTDDASEDSKYSKVDDGFAVKVVQCNNGTTTSAGDYALKITGVTGETTRSELTLTHLSVVDSSTNSTFAGLLTTSELKPNNNADSVLEVNSSNLQLTSNGTTYAFSNINTTVATETASSERKLERYDTTVTLSNSTNNGVYSTAIIHPLKIAATDQYPYEGQLRIQRQNGTMNIIITVIDATKVRVETDTSGDNIADYTQDVFWSELSSGF